jgi:DNA-binding beta-propeller fold protein YncE
VLVFRGSANGAEPPIRVIQGPCTGMVNPHAVSLDLAHREILVASLSSRAIAVFPMNANGNATPLRYIRGAKTRLGHVVGLGVDPETNVLVVANSEEVLFFNRTDDGDVAPIGEIKGEHTGIRDEPWELQIHQGKIFLAASNHLHVNVYTGVTLKDGFSKVPEDPWLNPELGFIGVWNVRDRGDVSPRAKIGGPFSQLAHPTGLALNPKDGEIYVTDSIRNGLFTFLVPDLLK